MTKRRLTQVAEYAGVSEATVSRVLNGSPDVGTATREAVLSALDVCGIERPSRYRAERARLIGLVVPDLQNPIFSAFAEALCGLLNKRGLIPVLCTRTADGVSEAHYIEMLLRQNIGGIVFIGASYADSQAPSTAVCCGSAGSRWCWSTPPTRTWASLRSGWTTRWPPSRR